MSTVKPKRRSTSERSEADGPTLHQALDASVGRLAKRVTRLGAARPRKARETARRWLTLYVLGRAAGRRQVDILEDVRRSGRAEGLREAFRAVAKVHHPDFEWDLADAVRFSEDEDRLRRAIRAAPRVSTLELAVLLLPDADPTEIESSAEAALESASARLRP
jgi:hypothetical protein